MSAQKIKGEKVVKKQKLVQVKPNNTTSSVENDNIDEKLEFLFNKFKSEILNEIKNLHISKIIIFKII